MADNFQTNDNILVDYDYQNVVLVDPNKTVNINGTVQERTTQVKLTVITLKVSLTNGCVL